jgi:hypothetical protein
LSRELEVSKQSKGGRHPIDVTPSKTEQLKQAGLSKSTANRYEELAGNNELSDLESFVMSPGQETPIENAVIVLAVSRSKIEREPARRIGH